MWGLDYLGIAYSANSGTVTAPLWTAGIVGVMLIVLFVLALIRTGLAGTLVFLALVGFGGWAMWSWTDSTRIAERRALEARQAALETQAMALHSPLACLNAGIGETIQAACERDVFATPEAAASAVSYTAARIALLNDGTGFASQHDPAFLSALDRLRAGLEHDRFGTTAHVLATLRNCTADRCDLLRLFRDGERVRKNMRENTFETHLAKAAPQWAGRPMTRSNADPARGTPLPPNYTLPSSASIPPVSIMAAEPTDGAAGPAGAPPSETAPASTGAVTPLPPRRPTQIARPPTRRPATPQPAPTPAAQTAPEPPSLATPPERTP